MSTIDIKRFFDLEHKYEAVLTALYLNADDDFNIREALKEAIGTNCRKSVETAETFRNSLYLIRAQRFSIETLGKRIAKDSIETCEFQGPVV